MVPGAFQMEFNLLAEAQNHDEVLFDDAYEAATDNEESDTAFCTAERDNRLNQSNLRSRIPLVLSLGVRDIISGAQNNIMRA